MAPTHDKSNYVTVRDAIGNLSRIEDGIADVNDPLHCSRKLGDLNKRRIQASREGGFWREWPEELKLACHKKDGGASFRSVYGRMSWDDVAPTMTTYCVGLGNGRFGHPEQDRAISMREAAIFQSFPKNYIFLNPDKPQSTATIARHIGNAVPVKLGEVIAESIKKHLKFYDGEQ
jgi:DNA (cytosine-5)-methyltransferase 1